MRHHTVVWWTGAKTIYTCLGVVEITLWKQLLNTETGEKSAGWVKTCPAASVPLPSPHSLRVPP